MATESIVEYINKLNKMYLEKYNEDEMEKSCRYWAKCKTTGSVKFRFDRVKIGKKYDTYLPGILFCGLEGRHDKADEYYRRTIPEISLDNPINQPSLTASNNHYRGVRYVLSYLISKLSDKTPPSNATIDELGKEVYVEHLQHFCLTNIYKCGFAQKTSGLPHSDIMKEECFKIFLSEIEILRPSFVVIQVVTGCPPNLWNALKERFGGNANLIASAQRNCNTSSYKLRYNDGNPLFCIWTYHGNGFPCMGRGGVFPNNEWYIEHELNPVLDETIRCYMETIRKTK